MVVLAWGVNDGEVGAELVLDLDHDLFGPELLLALQPGILVLDIVLSSIHRAAQPRSTNPYENVLLYLDLSTTSLGCAVYHDPPCSPKDPNA